MSHEIAAAAGARAASELRQTEAAFASVREAMIAELLATGPGQEAKRERLIVGCQIIDGVKQALLNVQNNGIYAQAALAQAELLRR